MVVLDFWATWCRPCVAAAPVLVKAAKAHPDVRIVGVSADEVDDIKQFAKDHAINYTLARDQQQDLWKSYFVQGLPTTIVIDAKGVVRSVEYGYGGARRIRGCRSARSVRVRDHRLDGLKRPRAIDAAFGEARLRALGQLLVGFERRRDGLG